MPMDLFVDFGISKNQSQWSPNFALILEPEGSQGVFK